MVFTRSYFLILIFQVLLTTQGCMDGLRSCFGYFETRESSAGPGICDLVADQLDCLTMVRQSCDPGTAPNVDGALSGLQVDYSNNCTFDNIGLTSGYEVTQCTKLFGECKASIADTSCSRITSYEACSEGISTFCTSDHLQNVTDIINSEKQRLTAEQGCVFATVTTQRVLLSGSACFVGFQSCYESQGVDTEDHPCVVAPVYESCYQSDVMGVCDASSTSTVSSVVSSKQSECDAAVVTTTLEPAPESTNLDQETTSIGHETTNLDHESTNLVQETTTPAQERTTPAQETTTPAQETTNLAQETTNLDHASTNLVQETTTPAQETTASAQVTTTPAQETKTSAQETLAKETTLPQETPLAQETAVASETTTIVHATATDALGTKDVSSTKETVVVSEKGPGQIHLYYGTGSNLRCTGFMLILGLSLSLVCMLEVIS